MTQHAYYAEAPRPGKTLSPEAVKAYARIITALDRLDAEAEEWERFADLDAALALFEG